MIKVDMLGQCWLNMVWHHQCWADEHIHIGPIMVAQCWANNVDEDDVTS